MRPLVSVAEALPDADQRGMAEHQGGNAAGVVRENGQRSEQAARAAMRCWTASLPPRAQPARSPAVTPA